MNPKIPIAAITDEFTPDLAVALDAMKPIGMQAAELRMIGAKNVLDLDDNELIFGEPTEPAEPHS